MNLKAQRAAVIAAAQKIVRDAKAAGREKLTAAETAEVEAKLAEARELKGRIDAAEKSRGIVDELAGLAIDDEDEVDDASGPSRKAGGAGRATWGRKIAGTVNGSPLGVKALFTGPVRVPAAVDLTDTGQPTPGGRLLDLIPRRELTGGNTFEYLRQTAKQNNAAPVADGGTKPTSVYSFEPVEDRARVVAHLSEPIPIRFLGADGGPADVDGLAELLDGQMLAGVLEALEDQLLNGDGTGENFPGLLSLSGVTNVAYATDELTTIRKARTALSNKGERPNAWVFNPADVERLDLMRETTEGGFLLNSAAADVLFGEGVARLQSLAVPEGTALLGDWTTARLRVRQGAHTLAATQGDGLWETNSAKLRSEGRFGVEWRRPQAFAVVDLTAV